MNRTILRSMLSLVATCLLVTQDRSQPQNKSKQDVKVPPYFSETAQVQFIVSAFDQESYIPIPEFTVRGRYLDPPASTGGSATGSGAVIIGLSGGNFGLQISAEGYDSEIIDSIHVPGKPGVMSYSTFPLRAFEPFDGTTVTLGVTLKRSNLAFGEQTRIRTFLSDTTFYYATSPPPELVEGTETLTRAIKDEARHIWPDADGSLELTTSCTAYIDKQGSVIRVEMYKTEKQFVVEVITNAVQKSKFIPGKVLGKSVNSKLYIPFELNLKNPLLAWGRNNLAMSPIRGMSVHNVYSDYGNRIHPVLNVLRMHEGVDFNVEEGTAVLATGDGKVKKISTQTDGFGLHIIIQHTGGYSTLFAHLSKAIVKEGDIVKQGEIIAYSGNTGLTSIPHLHYGVFKNGKRVDPKEFLPKK